LFIEGHCIFPKITLDGLHKTGGKSRTILKEIPASGLPLLLSKAADHQVLTIL